MKPTDQNTKQETQEEARSTGEREARNSKGELNLSPIMAPQPWSNRVGGGRGRGRAPECHWPSFLIQLDLEQVKAMLKALKWILIKYGKIESVQTQEFNKVFSFILEYRYVVLSRGMQLSELTKSKCSLVDLSEI
jgi:hypothetical protein